VLSRVSAADDFTTAVQSGSSKSIQACSIKPAPEQAVTETVQTRVTMATSVHGNMPHCLLLSQQLPGRATYSLLHAAFLPL
jgi:hypothetical protein